MTAGSAASLRVGLDATPLLGARTGVGRYVEGLLGGLAGIGGIDAVLTVFSLRGSLDPALRSLGHVSRRRLPARVLHEAWARGRWPAVQWLSGRVDVFHATNFVLPPTRRAGGVVSVHDLAFLHHSDTVTPAVLRYRDLVPRSAQRADVIVCFAQAVADEIVEAFGVSPDQVAVIPHGVDPAWSQARPASAEDLARWGLPPRYLLFVGNLEPRKNLGLLIRAHHAARRAHPQDVPPLVLVGPGGWGDRWDGAVPDRDDVVLAGFLPTDSVRSIVAGATAVCLPSRYEGFGLPLIETLAAGRPMLASDIPVHREVGGDAVRYVPSEVDAWSAALVEVSSGPADPDALARGQAHAAAFTWERSARLHRDVYARAAAHR